MMKTVFFFILIYCCFAGHQQVFAQAGPINDSALIQSGSPANVANEPTFVTKKKSTSTTNDTIQKHSPAKATWLSVMIPGGGQFYNRKYWKVPVIYTAAGAAFYSLLFYQKQYDGFRAAYIERNATNTNNDPFYRQFQTVTLRSNRDYYRYYRDLSYIGLGAVYILQIVDAAVDAHFQDFKITEDLTMQIRPQVPIASMPPQLHVSFRF
ncbi:MAG: DUF5683 domain-containing protein [Bacteroidia bacterium]|nr:DUF5683 domain-containing protein [Bacteroidia bacterium]